MFHCLYSFGYHASLIKSSGIVVKLACIGVLLSLSIHGELVLGPPKVPKSKDAQLRHLKQQSIYM